MKSRKLVKCQACDGKNLQCKPCDGDGYVYPSPHQAPQLSLVPAWEPQTEDQALQELADKKYSLLEWKERIDRETALVNAELLAALEANSKSQVYGSNGVGYSRCRKWATLEESPFILRQIGKIKEEAAE